jgi:methylated-DNA-protein-cysteine methyltransferase-like protein
MTEFTQQLIDIIKRIPKGKVASYGQVAAIAGNPRAARRVAWLLSSSSHKRGLPWQRVINARGEIAFPRDSAAFKRQKALLRAEGVTFLAPAKVDMARHQWTG